MKKSIWFRVAVCLGLCMFCVASVQAQVPHVLVEQTVQRLVNYGVKNTPELVRAVTIYYTRVARTSGNLRTIADDDFILEHTHTFMTMHKEFLSSKAVRRLEKELSKPRPVSNTLLETKLKQAAQEASSPVTEISVPDHMMTGEQLIRRFMPNWRGQLFGRFTAQEQDIIWEAVLKTDQWFFERGENGQVIFKAEDWDYEGRLAVELRLLLQEQNMMFTPLQWDSILEVQKSVKTSLPLVFTLTSLEGFVALQGRLPARKTENLGEYDLAHILYHIKVNAPQDNALVKQIIAFVKANRWGKVSQKRWEELLQFWQDYDRLPMAGVDKSEENSLARAIYRLCNAGDPADPFVQKIKEFVEEHRTRPAHRTPQQWLEELERFWEKNHRLPTRRSQKPEEKSLMEAVSRIKSSGNPDDPFVQKIKDFLEEHRTRKTPQEWWLEIRLFCEEHQRMPSLKAQDPKEQALGRAVSNLKYNGNPEDPFVQRVREISRDYVTKRGRKPKVPARVAEPVFRDRPTVQ